MFNERMNGWTDERSFISFGVHFISFRSSPPRRDELWMNQFHPRFISFHRSFHSFNRIHRFNEFFVESKHIQAVWIGNRFWTFSALLYTFTFCSAMIYMTSDLVVLIYLSQVRRFAVRAWGRRARSEPSRAAWLGLSGAQITDHTPSDSHNPRRGQDHRSQAEGGSSWSQF